MVGSSQHSSVGSLSTALNLKCQFKATKILDIYLVLNLFASHTLIRMSSKQHNSFSSYLFFRKYGERHPEITPTFNSMQLKKIWRRVFGFFVWFVVVCCFVFYTSGICFFILLCSHVRDYQTTKSQYQWLDGGRRKIIPNRSFVTSI